MTLLFLILVTVFYVFATVFCLVVPIPPEPTHWYFRLSRRLILWTLSVWWMSVGVHLVRDFLEVLNG